MPWRPRSNADAGRWDHGIDAHRHHNLALLTSAFTAIGDNVMDPNLKLAAFASILLLSSTVVRADDNLLIGTWKLKSFVWEISATGERNNQFGEHPDGYLSYTIDGRVGGIITADKRIKPREEIANRRGKDQAA
jgi:hypothetical protein